MNETEFLKAIEAEPANPVPRLVYADWLDEQGDPRGELLRIQEELRRIDVPHRAAKEARMHELLKRGRGAARDHADQLDRHADGADLSWRVCDGQPRSRKRADLTMKTKLRCD